MPDGDSPLVAFDTLELRVPSQLSHGFLERTKNFAEGSAFRAISLFLEPEHGVVEAFERVHGSRSKWE